MPSEMMLASKSRTSEVGVTSFLAEVEDGHEVATNLVVDADAVSLESVLRSA
jgi:hypothetical protein